MTFFVLLIELNKYYIPQMKVILLTICFNFADFYDDYYYDNNADDDFFSMCCTYSFVLPGDHKKRYPI